MGKIEVSRRRLLQASVGLAASATLGLRPGEALAAPRERKFIFLFASGAWDTTTVLDPHFDVEGVDMDDETLLGEVGNLRWTAGDDRPFASRFFRRWGRRACIINGVDSHSVGHASGTRFVLTGTSASSYPDWPTLIAGRGRGDYPLPHVVFSGPSFPGTLGSAVVKAGEGALLDLLDGSILGDADTTAPVWDAPSDDILDAVVHARTADFLGQRGGLGNDKIESLLASQERAMELEGRQFEAGLDDLGNDLADQLIQASELMRLGLSRCAMMRIPGGWDAHGGVQNLGAQQDALFEALDGLMDHMSATPGLTTPWLSDEVVICCMSEFGRTPRLNGSQGKDHWPYGSMLLMGSGVKGNQVVGKTDDELIAEPIDFTTGEYDPDGEMLACEHVGMALVELAGLEPEEHLPGVPTLEAVLQ